MLLDELSAEQAGVVPGLVSGRCSVRIWAGAEAKLICYAGYTLVIPGKCCDPAHTGGGGQAYSYN
jgi:hypothetical protein